MADVTAGAASLCRQDPREGAVLEPDPEVAAAAAAAYDALVAAGQPADHTGLVLP